jgi:hypothetical protein
MEPNGVGDRSIFGVPKEDLFREVDEVLAKLPPKMVFDEQAAAIVALMYDDATRGPKAKVVPHDEDITKFVSEEDLCRIDEKPWSYGWKVPARGGIDRRTKEDGSIVYYDYIKSPVIFSISTSPGVKVENVGMAESMVVPDHGSWVGREPEEILPFDNPRFFDGGCLKFTFPVGKSPTADSEICYANIEYYFVPNDSEVDRAIKKFRQYGI